MTNCSLPDYRELYNKASSALSKIEKALGLPQGGDNTLLNTLQAVHYFKALAHHDYETAERLKLLIEFDIGDGLPEVQNNTNKMVQSIEPCPLIPRDSTSEHDAVEKLLEKTANEFFKGKDKAHGTPISYGELVWLMRSLLTAAQTLPIPLEPFADHSQLVNTLWESDSASALTNQAARAIEKLSCDFKKAVNDRNAAWFQLEQAGIAITPVTEDE